MGLCDVDIFSCDISSISDNVTPYVRAHMRTYVCTYVHTYPTFLKGSQGWSRSPKFAMKILIGYRYPIKIFMANTPTHGCQIWPPCEACSNQI